MNKVTQVHCLYNKLNKRISYVMIHLTIKRPWELIVSMRHIECILYVLDVVLTIQHTPSCQFIWENTSFIETAVLLRLLTS